MMLATWFYALMIATSPPDRYHAGETAAERDARYHEIARDLATVVEDPAEAPVFGGPQGRARTGALLLGLSYVESGWRKDVDEGAKRGPAGDSCLLQLNIGRGHTREGWSHADLTGDRTKCFRAGLHLARMSYGACGSSPAEDRLAAYATGRCDSEKGKLLSRARVAVARRMLARGTP